MSTHGDGDLDVPHHYRVGAVPLGVWLARQRKARAEGELDQTVINALNALGMSWDARPRRLPDESDQRQAVAAKSWSRGIVAAKAFHSGHGDLRDPGGLWVGGLRLDSWLTRQRAARRDGRLTADQIAALDTLEVRWQPTPPLPTRRRGLLPVLRARGRAQRGCWRIPVRPANTQVTPIGVSGR
ncbi:helicase associated domain-containing protein [Streptomyces sp. NPDC058695]|uniref:helicase associated domain-containing protein n=1 Tax=Streptomyces sp. NPDC058695 TaxID=3346604 RepID=UPI003667BE99